MFRRSRRPFFIFVMLSLGLLSGCAGGQLAKIAGNGDLPKELQEKFEVREATAVTPAAEADAKAKAELIPAEKPVAAKKKKARRKKINMTAAVLPGGAAVVPSAVFVYPSRRPSTDPIWLNETLTYDIAYFGVSAGDFVLRSEPYKYVGTRKVYHIRGTAVSSKVFSLFYRLNDMFETFIDYEGIFSHRFHIDLDESKQTRDSLELNDSEKGQTYYWNRWNRSDAPYTETKEFFPITPFSQDSLSALYFLRMQPLKDGDVVTFPVINEGKTWEAVITVLGREMIDGPDGQIRAIKLLPEHKYQGVLKKQGDSFLWLSDDDRKFLVRLEAKVKIGTVVAKLKRIEPGIPPTP